MPRSSTTPERILSFQNASVLCPCYVFIFCKIIKSKVQLESFRSGCIPILSPFYLVKNTGVMALSKNILKYPLMIRDFPVSNYSS